MTRASAIDEMTRALNERTSIRAYDPAPLAQDELAALFALAQRAPSWCNIQPWRVVITAPPVTGEVSSALLKAAESELSTPDIPFPLDYPEPYLQHRRACGASLYEAMGITRHDREARRDAWLRNYQLFDAPHLAVVSRDRHLGEYATLDVGIWLGFLFAAASTLGIDCCAMASLAAHPGVFRSKLAIPEHEIILFGIVFGRRSPRAPANQCRTTRSPVAENVRFVGF